MENSPQQYVKPSYKILGRFISECVGFLKQGYSIASPIKDFGAYYQYNRRLIPPYQAAKPWIVHQAFLRLETLIRPEMRVLEFGSGGSTLYLAPRVQSILSIEHDAKWYNMIHDQLSTYPNVAHVLIEPEKILGESSYRSVNGLYVEGLDFEKYAKGADHVSDESIDLLIIDGRVRPQTLQRSLSKLKPGGLLVFDNSERSSYQQEIKRLLTGWEREDYHGVTIYDAFFNFTSLFFKPLA